MKYKEKVKKACVLPVDWRKKLRIRSKSRQLLKKGYIKKQSCQLCYCPESKMVHVNYESPENIIWLCKKHYLNFLKERKKS